MSQHQKTYWNGEPCEARRVLVLVGKSPRKTWWCSEMEGTVRKAVEVRYPPSCEDTFYLDDENGLGWLKVTAQRGSPSYGHRSLPAAEVIGEV